MPDSSVGIDGSGTSCTLARRMRLPSARCSTITVAGVVASLTGIKGNGLLAVLTVMATVLSVAAVRSWGDLRLPARLRRPGRRVGPVRPGRRSGPTRVAPAPRSARREVAAEVARAGARTLVIVASCLVVALLAGVVANRLGDFYPSWSLAWSDLGTALL